MFLELKKKFKAWCTSAGRRCRWAQAAAYLRDGTPPAKTDHIFGKSTLPCGGWSRRPGCIWPTTAQPTPGGGRPLRITFDTCIRWADGSARPVRGGRGRLLLGPDDVLMEIKIPDAMPLWLVRALTDMGLFPASFSKYGTCYARYLSVGQKAGLPAGEQQGGILSA